MRLKINYLLLILLLLVFITPVNSLEIGEGVVINTTNITWSFVNNVSMNNLTIGNNFIVFGGDNLSLVPSSPVNISIYEWVSTQDHNFSVVGAASIPYSVLISGYPGAIKVGSAFIKTPFISTSDLLYWSYNFDRRYNVAFYDEFNKALIDFENVTISFISDSYSNNYTTTNGTLPVSLPSDVYLVRFSGDSYEQRFYELDVTSFSTGNLNLYLIGLDNYTNVTINVIDQFVIPVSEARVKALKYDIATNTYLLQEIGITDNEGNVYMSLAYDSEFYKFLVVYDGDVKLTTTPAYITSSNMILQIVIGEGFGDNYYHFQNIDYSITFNSVTNNFRYNWNDDTGISNNFCLYTYRMTAINEYLINNTCVASASGTILHPINIVNGSMYVSKAYYTNSNGETSFLTQLTKTFNNNINTGNSGLFLQLLLTIAFSFIAVWSVPVSAIATPTSLILGRFIGLNSIGYEYLIPIMIVGIIIAYITSNKS